MTVPRQAIVLAAGMGQRLRPYTNHTPKPLVPFLNRPLLAGTLEDLSRAGVERVWINAWHLAEQLVEWAADWRDEKLQLTVVVESELLDTGGGLVNIQPLLAAEPVLVLAGDIIADFDYGALAQRHQDSAAEATMALTPAADPQAFGPVAIDHEQMLCDIVGRLGCPGERALVNASAHLLEPRFLDRLPRSGKSCLVRDGYLPAMAAGATVAGWVHPGAWAETGTPLALLSAQQAALAGTLPLPPGRIDAGGLLSAPGSGQLALVHPTARLGDGVELLDGSTIGPGATLGDGVTVRQCLVAGGVSLQDHTTWEHQIIDSQETADQLLSRHGAPIS